MNGTVHRQGGYALRLPSTLEQFRKWSTGSSYPAILDEDVEKTLIPVPDTEEQNKIAEIVFLGLKRRAEAIAEANSIWTNTIEHITKSIANGNFLNALAANENGKEFKLEAIKTILQQLPELACDNAKNRGQANAFDDTCEKEEE